MSSSLRRRLTGAAAGTGSARSRGVGHRHLPTVRGPIAKRKFPWPNVSVARPATSRTLRLAALVEVVEVEALDEVAEGGHPLQLFLVDARAAFARRGEGGLFLVQDHACLVELVC